MSTPDVIRKAIEDIVEARGIYWLAKQMGGQHCTRISRMLASGRCQPHEWETIQSLRASIVPCETSHTVTANKT
jgi:hypothetical protein